MPFDVYYLNALEGLASNMAAPRGIGRPPFYYGATFRTANADLDDSALIQQKTADRIISVHQAILAKYGDVVEIGPVWEIYEAIDPSTEDVLMIIRAPIYLKDEAELNPLLDRYRKILH